MEKRYSGIVSVIIPTLNSAKYIGRCLKGIENQSYTSIEILIVDAGSADQTLEIVESFKNRLTINLFHAPGTNMGEARNLGIKRALGDYITFCDSDDYYLKNKILHQVECLMQNPLLDACYFDALHFYSDSPRKIFLNGQTGYQGNILKILAKRQFINLNTLMIRNKRTPSLLFPEGLDGKFGEDWKYILELAKNGFSFRWIPDHDVVVEIRTDSHTSWDRQFLMKLVALKHFKQSKSDLVKLGITKAYLCRIYFSRVIKLLMASLICENKTLKKTIHELNNFSICKTEIEIMRMAKTLISPLDPLIMKFIYCGWMVCRKRKQIKMSSQ